MALLNSAGPACLQVLRGPQCGLSLASVTVTNIQYEEGILNVNFTGLSDDFNIKINVLNSR